MIHVNIDDNSETLLLLSGLSHSCCSSGRLQSAKHRFKVIRLFIYDAKTGSAVFLESTWAQPTAQESSTKSPLGGSSRK